VFAAWKTKNRPAEAHEGKTEFNKRKQGDALAAWKTQDLSPEATEGKTEFDRREEGNATCQHETVGCYFNFFYRLPIRSPCGSRFYEEADTGRTTFTRMGRRRRKFSPTNVQCAINRVSASNHLRQLR
jgi:hypothetical protein